MAAASCAVSRKPTLLISEPDHIYYELPPGKIGKDGKLKIQQRQKGETCLFYAVKRILTEEQIRSPHGKLCAILRKRYTAIDAITVAGSKEHCALIEEAVKEFFHGKGLDPHKATFGFLHDRMTNIYKGNIPEKMLIDFAHKFESDGITRAITMRNAADAEIVKGYGLREVFYGDLQTSECLLKVLETKGPLVITGHYGKGFYGESTPLSSRVGPHLLYGWSTETLESKPKAKGVHATVLCGASIIKGGQNVYWIDPQDSNNPDDPTTQRKFVTPYKAFKQNCFAAFIMTAIDEFPLDVQAVMPCAFYNPAFSAS